MKPSFSVIVFTVLAGAGYGLWAWLGLALGMGVYATGISALMLPLAVGFVLAGAGLLASTAHLGKPWRAWRGLTQWKSSWLSREAVLALASFVPVLMLAAMRHLARDTLAVRGTGLLLAMLALATIYCTARIYSSLKPIDAWRLPQVVAGYLLLGLASGAVWLWQCLSINLRDRMDTIAPVTHAGWLTGLALLVLLAGLVKRSYWRQLDAINARPAVADAGAATGLDRFGVVRPLEAPASEPAYLMREMGYVLARRHRQPLRRLAMTASFVLPLFAAGVAALVPAAEAWLAPLALLSVMGGLFMERWLFFAEARHRVAAYFPAA